LTQKGRKQSRRY